MALWVIKHISIYLFLTDDYNFLSSDSKCEKSSVWNLASSSIEDDCPFIMLLESVQYIVKLEHCAVINLGS